MLLVGTHYTNVSGMHRDVMWMTIFSISKYIKGALFNYVLFLIFLIIQKIHTNEYRILKIRAAYTSCSVTPYNVNDNEICLNNFYNKEPRVCVLYYHYRHNTETTNFNESSKMLKTRFSILQRAYCAPKQSRHRPRVHIQGGRAKTITFETSVIGSFRRVYSKHCWAMHCAVRDEKLSCNGAVEYSTPHVRRGDIFSETVSQTWLHSARDSLVSLRVQLFLTTNRF